jgi:hypothetical protein
VNAPEPELGPLGPVGEIATRLANELHHARRYPRPRCRGYRGTSPCTAPSRHRTRQRRIVRTLTPNRRPAAVGP